MADDQQNKTISKTKSGFPPYLDFDKLRGDAIAYLGTLTGKIWTDYNVHDPGITILESLIYAVMDLGYRTNLPVEDLFATAPATATTRFVKDDNFLKPVQILTGNPVTITDYRKMLVDIPYVKNAWLVVDEGPLNGLYHVYVQLDEKTTGDQPLIDKTIQRIRKSLMAHRNLCEDFVDVTILCSLDIGVCAQIELEDDADAETVYFSIVETLTNWLSPSPVFYSLQQLLDKGRTIDEIFAGRPYNIRESHGFVDTVEFEAIQLRKELHLSDVYHLLFDVPGIRNVRNLTWMTCCDGKTTRSDWKLVLPQNYIPEFSMKCSGFAFVRKGLPIQVDLATFESFVQLKLSKIGKALYKEPSDFLDPEYPKGVYRSDLADYYSIQNDFPRVYGIGEGTLSADATVERKAQALQLQGFLLFFDQLLANYLMQLKNIRSLFSLQPAKKDEAHTYFSGQLTNVPQYEQLLRFRSNPGDDNLLGSEGTILAFPIERKKLQAVIDGNKLSSVNLDKDCDCSVEFPPYGFCFGTDRDEAVKQLQIDLQYGNYTPIVASNSNDCYFFYFLTSSPDIAVISKRLYGSQAAAANAASSIQFVATVDQNFRRFTDTCCENKTDFFSFTIQLNLDEYAGYLQSIVEDQRQYTTRRQQFLDHLLARFAERFTDYAMLSAPFFTAEQLAITQIKAEQQYLQHYPDLSGNRGKAYDYHKNNWNNYNISGFEKRFKALAGMRNWQKHYLCNFVVEPATILYQLSVYFFNEAFTVRNKTATKKEALDSLKSVYSQLSAPCFENAPVDYAGKWEVFIRDKSDNKYGYTRLFDNEADAKGFAQKLDNVFRLRPTLPADVFVSQHIRKVQLSNHAGKAVAEARGPFKDPDVAKAFAEKAAEKPAASLQPINSHSGLKLDRLLPIQKVTLPYLFLDDRVLDFRSTGVIHITGEKTTFSALSAVDNLQFNSLEEFDDVKQAKKAFRRLLELLPVDANYTIDQNKQTGLFELFLTDGGKNVAILFGPSLAQQTDAWQKKTDVLTAIGNHTYTLDVTDPIPYEWEFNYRAEDLAGDAITYVSQGEYKTEQAAIDAAKAFYEHFDDVSFRASAGQPTLTLKTPDGTISLVPRPTDPAADPVKAEQLLAFSQQLHKQVNKTTDDDLEALLKTNIVNPGENYIYKLVDKDRRLAGYPSFKTLTTAALGEAKRDELMTRGLAGYDPIDIATGGNIICIRKDEGSRTKWYHYRVICTNRKYTRGDCLGKDWVLFESCLGYPSEAAARDAFAKNYLDILKHARNVSQYGPGKYISLVELLVHDLSACGVIKTIVYVPTETSAEFGGYEVDKELAMLAASYPIWYLKKHKYRFVLGTTDEAAKTFTADWQSNLTYSTPEEAMRDYRFFLVMLRYAGNYCLEWDPVEKCYIIFIRETLALSAHGFPDQATAWGPEGVGKFICVAQSPGGFHNFQAPPPCYYGFFVACANAGLVHPCRYETPSRRDAALQALFQASNFNFFDWLDLPNPDELVLLDNDAARTPLATIRLRERDRCYVTLCEALVLLADAVNDDNNFVESSKKGTYQLNVTVKKGDVSMVCPLARPKDPAMKLEEWKTRLRKLACWIPVRVVDDACGQSGQRKYFVSIRLPGLSNCGDDIGTATGGAPCTDGCNIGCYLAWKSDCCFDTCCDAFLFYLISLQLLADIKNYRPVSACDCQDYGIGLYPQLSLKEAQQFNQQLRSIYDKVRWLCQPLQKQDPNDPAGNQLARYGAGKRLALYEKNYCSNEIVAFTPQFYTSSQMACEAAERARRLIDSEGLHLVEHILLRPCPEADDKCPNRPQPTGQENNCTLKWIPGGEKDPCGVNEDKPIIFVPGNDPYSFIATVALPAWPARFRTDTNRAILEKMLQREAPAHVLLRILWLNPREFCCFEAYFKQWNEWLAEKLSSTAYSDCDFLGFLFKKKFSPPEVCTDCQPCSCDDAPELPCQPQDDGCHKSVLENIQDIYGWGKVDVDDFAICEALAPVRRLKPVPPAVPAPAPQPQPPAPQPQPPAVPKVAASAPDPTPAREPEPPAPHPAIPEKEKIGHYRQRATAYNTTLTEYNTPPSDNPMIQEALTFLKKPAPTPEEFDTLVKKILKSKVKGLVKKDKIRLTGALAWQYLDRYVFNATDIDNIVAAKPTFEWMKENRVDTEDLYRKWDPRLIGRLEPGINLKKVKKIITG